MARRSDLILQGFTWATVHKTLWGRLARVPMLPSHVCVPARRPGGLGAPVEIRDADDWPHRVPADYLTLVESRPCVTAEVVQGLRGRFWVRFPDGTEKWVAPVPDVWGTPPQPADRVCVRWSAGARMH